MADRPPYTITVPKNWTIDQVEAVLEFLDALETVVYDAYEHPILDALMQENSCLDLDDTIVNDELIPF